MKMFKMGFEGNIREIKRNFADLTKWNETKVEPNNLKGFMDYIYDTIGTDKAITITPITALGKQWFMVKF